MRVHPFGFSLLVCWLFVASFCHADDQTVEIVGAAECADCQHNNFRTSQAFSGLHVTIDCKLKNGEIKRVGDTELDEGGEFKLSLLKEIIHDGEALNKDCYAQLHNAAAAPCPAHDGLDLTKLVVKSQIDHNIITLAPAKALRFSSALCTSKFLWPFFKYPPLPKIDPWKKKWPKITIPHLKSFGHPWVIKPEPKTLPPLLPLYKPKPKLLPPPLPIYKPLPPPIPIYKPKPKPPVVKPLPPVYKPIPKPPVVKPLPPVYKPKPKPPVVKPLPPVYKPKPKPPVVKPLPPVYKPKPKPPVVKPLPPVYKPKPKPPVVKPLPPVYKPIPKPPVVKPLPPPVPIYKPPVVKPLPPPVPIYKPPVVIKPLPPIFPLFPLPPLHKKPCPPFTKIPPKFKHHKFGHYFPKPPLIPNP